MSVSAASPWVHVPRATERARLLLGLVQYFGCLSTSPTELGRLLGTSRETARQERDYLVETLKLVQVRDGLLALTEEGEQILRAEAAQVATDPKFPGLAVLPAEWFGSAKKSTTAGYQSAKKSTTARPDLTRAEMLAAAEVFLDALPERSSRTGIRGDGERARMAGVTRQSARVAREKLHAQGTGIVVQTAELKRGRLLYRLALRERCGSEHVDSAAPRKRPGQKSTTRTAKKTPTPMMGSQKPQPIVSANSDDGCRQASDLDGSSMARAAESKIRRLTRAKSVRPTRSSLNRAATAERAKAAIFGAAGSAAVAERLVAGAAVDAISRVLAATCCWDLELARRQEVARTLAERGLNASAILDLAVDVALDPTESIPAVLVSRLDRVVRGETVDHVRTKCRRGWPSGRLREELLRAHPEAKQAQYPRDEARVQARTAGSRSYSRLIGALQANDHDRAQKAAAALLREQGRLDVDVIARDARASVDLVRRLIDPQRQTAPSQAAAVSA